MKTKISEIQIKICNADFQARYKQLVPTSHDNLPYLFPDRATLWLSRTVKNEGVGERGEIRHRDISQIYFPAFHSLSRPSHSTRAGLGHVSSRHFLEGRDATHTLVEGKSDAVQACPYRPVLSLLLLIISGPVVFFRTATSSIPSRPVLSPRKH